MPPFSFIKSEFSPKFTHVCMLKMLALQFWLVPYVVCFLSDKNNDMQWLSVVLPTCQVSDKQVNFPTYISCYKEICEINKNDHRFEINYLYAHILCCNLKNIERVCLISDLINSIYFIIFRINVDNNIVFTVGRHAETIVSLWVNICQGELNDSKFVSCCNMVS